MTRRIVLVAIALLGCGTEPAALQGTAWPDCAPWDGPATRIVIPLDNRAGGASWSQLTLALYEAPEAIRGEVWRITAENMIGADGTLLGATAAARPDVRLTGKGPKVDRRRRACAATFGLEHLSH